MLSATTVGQLPQFPKPSVRIHIVAEWCCYRWLLNQEHLYYVLLYLDLERKHVSRCSAKIRLQNHGMSPLALRTLSLHLWRGGLVAQETRLLLWRCQGSWTPPVTLLEKSGQECCKEVETSHTRLRLWTMETELLLGGQECGEQETSSAFREPSWWTGEGIPHPQDDLLFKHQRWMFHQVPPYHAARGQEGALLHLSPESSREGAREGSDWAPSAVSKDFWLMWPCFHSQL